MLVAHLIHISNVLQEMCIGMIPVMLRKMWLFLVEVMDVRGIHVISLLEPVMLVAHGLILHVELEVMDVMLGIGYRLGIVLLELVAR